MMVAFLRVFTFIAALLVSGCVASAAGKVVKTTADVAVGTVEVAAKGAGAAADAMTGNEKSDEKQISQDHHEKSHHDDNNPRPFDEARDAQFDVDVALAKAKGNGRNVLLVLGGNWCHDSRGLAGKFERKRLAKVIAENYELVWVDVGHRDRNLDVALRFGVPELFGTPTVLILTPDAELLNADSVHDWRTADSKPYDETLAYFERFAELR